MDTDGAAADEHDGDDRAGPVADLHCPAVPAEPERLAGLRRALTEWAERIGMAVEQVEVVALAGYEALANVAAHAYPDGGGVLDMHAVYRPDTAQVEVTVSDHGSWRRPPAERADMGGRGLVLIRSLAEQAEVTAGTSGTTVRMAWTVVPQAEAVRPSPP
ncbi:ATP-binding protein [Haloactinomyces albus]|uniref:Anti-sigma regulatory factor (Ser/Thr protein kinase) n=1 Tax=Haloactinomyces albus TaxID=1352928 RepID=A0AAE4CKC9_9ACTN|nr:ATP-binding protein [Haloactinomyces albus]MDR7300609.1 anti-sigma regulatory factor (Ser/Thr protein kinase) [Haloactinomyces albus]